MPRSATSPALSSVVSSSLSSLIFAFLPKCPACLVILLAPFGIKLPNSAWFLTYVVVMLAGIPLVFFATPLCRKSCGLRPMFLALAGLLVMTLGRVAFDSTALVAVGAVTMFAAAFWTARSSTVTAKLKACDHSGAMAASCGGRR